MTNELAYEYNVLYKKLSTDDFTISAKPYKNIEQFYSLNRYHPYAHAEILIESKQEIK